MKIRMDHNNLRTIVSADDGRETLAGALELVECVLKAQGYNFDSGSLSVTVTLDDGRVLAHCAEDFYHNEGAAR